MNGHNYSRAPLAQHVWKDASKVSNPFARYDLASLHSGGPGHRHAGGCRNHPWAMNVVYDSFNLLADHVHTNSRVRHPRVGAALKNDHHRFAVHFTHGQFPGPGPAVVMEEISRVPKLPGKPIGNTEPGVGTDQFTHTVPVASIKAIHIKLHNSRQLWTRTSS